MRIQMPDKSSANTEEISIVGYEHAVWAAKEDILKIVQELVRGGDSINLCKCTSKLMGTA